MKRVWATDELEQNLRAEGRLIVAGADEVGRGALAGPLVVATVVLPADWLEPVCDSKMLSAGARARLSEIILSTALGVGFGVVEAPEIDALGLSSALRVACVRSLEDINLPISQILLDGNIDFLAEYGLATTVVGGDRLSISIASASIVAKHYRDELMRAHHELYPAYGFCDNVGYGTLAHRQAIKVHGYSPLHRRSFKVADI